MATRVFLPDTRGDWLRPIFSSSSQQQNTNKDKKGKNATTTAALLFGVVSAAERRIRIVSAVPCGEMIREDLELQSPADAHDDDDDDDEWRNNTEVGGAVTDAHRVLPGGVRWCGVAFAHDCQKSVAQCKTLSPQYASSSMLLHISVRLNSSSGEAAADNNSNSNNNQKNKNDNNSAFKLDVTTTTTTSSSSSSSSSATAAVVVVDGNEEEFSLTNWSVYDTNPTLSMTARTLESVVMTVVKGGGGGDGGDEVECAAGSNGSTTKTTAAAAANNNKQQQQQRRQCFVQHCGAASVSDAAKFAAVVKGKRTLNTRVDIVTFSSSSSSSSSSSQCSDVRAQWIQYMRERLAFEDEEIKIKSAEAQQQQQRSSPSSSSSPTKVAAPPKEARWHETTASVVTIRVDPECSAVALKKLAQSIVGIECCAAVVDTNTNQQKGKKQETANTSASSPSQKGFPLWLLSAILVLLAVVAFAIFKK